MSIAPRIVWGSLDLTAEPFLFEFGSDFGAPQNVAESLALLLIDGEIEVSQRDSNRQISFNVLTDETDMLSHAEAERLLVLEASKPQNELLVDPGDDRGPAFVFDTFKAQVKWERDDVLEQNGIRRFSVVMSAAPFSRSVEETVVRALATGEEPPPIDTAVVDDCTSTTGWALATTPPPSAAYTASGPTVVSGEVRGTVSKVSLTGPSSDTSVALTRAGLAESMTTTPYLEVRGVRLIMTVVDSALTFKINGVTKDIVAKSGSTYYLDCSDVTTLTSVEVVCEWATSTIGGGGTYSQTLAIGSIVRTNRPPILGSARQMFRSLPVGGSARTQGSLQIEHASAALGEVLAYTCVNDGSGYQPPCRQYRVDGGTVTADSSVASGAYSPLDAATAETYDIPAKTLPPGTYSIMVRLKAPSLTLAGILWSASTRVGTTDRGTATGIKFPGVTTSWALYSVGRVALPPVALSAETDSFVRLEVWSNERVDIDECYLFNTDTGALTWVDCGTATPSTGGSSNRLWIDTASLDWPRPAVWLGIEEDRADARHAVGKTEIRALGTHLFPPGNVNVFTLTGNAQNAAVSLRHHNRWHSNAAD